LVGCSESRKGEAESRLGFLVLERERIVRWESGKLLLVFHFSIRFVVGLSGMWESRSDFQGLWEAGCAFHQSVISTGKGF
jgi:hypothetical protein